MTFSTIITIATVDGPRDTRGELVGHDVAIHLTTGRDPNTPAFTLSHLPTGRGLIRSGDRELLKRVGETLEKIVPREILQLTEHDQVEAQMPQPVVDWLKHCHCEGWTEPPSLNGDHASPGRTKMPKPKTFKARPVAQKIVRQLAQSMTPENRRAFHEGLRVATVDHVTDALALAFEAGKGGCVFSKD